MSIAKEGYSYILILAVVGGITLLFGFLWIGAGILVLAGFVVFFFRDPERNFIVNGGEILSPADGKIVSIRKDRDQDTISIFLSVFNVHVNRAPVAGKITEIQYSKGKFLAAFDERASSENERNSITIDHEGKLVRFVQIAGLIARRIICWKREGETLAAGERIGLIKFGSRVDVFFPPGATIRVKMGDKVRAGETVLGDLV